MKWFCAGLGCFLVCISPLLKAEEETMSELYTELKSARAEYARLHNQISQLEQKIAKQRIKMIEDRVALAAIAFQSRECTSKEIYSLFHDERTLLVEIIQSVPACANEAQGVLDKILTYITDMSDKLE